MKKGSFIFDGVSSDTVKTLIQSRPVIEAPLRKVEWRSTYGVDGEMPFDEGAYNNTTMDMLMFTNGDNLIADRQALYNLLDSRGTYKEFIPYFDPDKIYRVMLNEKMSFENKRFFGQVQTLSVKFTVKPYKHLVSNDPIIVTATPSTVTNPTNYVSQPIIKVVGSGAVTLSINGRDFNIKNVENSIVINSERYSAYHEDVNGTLTPKNYQIASREYPIFEPGDNVISITGTVTELNIEPRWRSLV